MSSLSGLLLLLPTPLFCLGKKLPLELQKSSRTIREQSPNMCSPVYLVRHSSVLFAPSYVYLRVHCLRESWNCVFSNI